MLKSPKAGQQIKTKGVPCCAGTGSRGTKPWRHPTASPPRGPSAGHQRPSRPFGLRSLTQTRETSFSNSLIAFNKSFQSYLLRRIQSSMCKSIQQKCHCQAMTDVFNDFRRQICRSRHPPQKKTCERRESNPHTDVSVPKSGARDIHSRIRACFSS